MSDPTTEPGVPAEGTTNNLPPAAEKSVASEAQKRVPNRVLALAARPDRLILRLNKLLAQPGGLSTFLSTFNYTLYLVSHLQTATVPLQLRVAALLNRLLQSPSLVTLGPVANGTSAAALGALISRARTTLRLFGLFPMYAWLRQLLQGPKPGQDHVLYTTAVTQCIMYMTFQFLENVGLLTDNGVLPAAATARWTKTSGGTTAKIYLWGYRAWMAGVLCDFVRLGREAQLKAAQRAEKGVEVSRVEREKEDYGWWRELVVPLSWMPVAVHASVEGGVPGMTLGIMGAAGLMAGVGKTSQLWADTK